MWTPDQARSHGKQYGGKVTAEQDRLDSATIVEFYWRPGCSFCMALQGPLRESGLPLREINIWEDPQGAARVREIANGNETVPTVVIGEHAMVNPSYREVEAVVRKHAPDIADRLPPAEERKRFRFFRQR